MIIQLQILTSIFSAGILVGASYWITVIYHATRTKRKLLTARDGLQFASEQDEERSVCVIIPAHNEASKIAGLIASLKAQDHEKLRVVLALDRCTDETEALAFDAIGDDDRFEIVSISACPTDWAGKVNAVCHAMAESSGCESSDYLLFADADTIFAPECLRATVAIMREQSLGLLSLLSTLTYGRWFEYVVQPAAGFELLYQYPLIRANRPDDRRAFANGQFMMFTKDAYQTVGGHEAVHEELLEDLALARLMEQAELSTGVLMADGMLTCSMYDSFEQFCKGWKRIYTESAKRRADRLKRAALRVRVAGSVMPFTCLISIMLTAFTIWLNGYDVWMVAAFGIGILGLGIQAVALNRCFTMGRVPLIAVIGYPVGAWLVGSIKSRAARDLTRGEPTRWGGRSYERELRQKPSQTEPKAIMPTGKKMSQS